MAFNLKAVMLANTLARSLVSALPHAADIETNFRSERRV